MLGYNSAGSVDSVLLWDAFCWHGLGEVIPLEGKVNASHSLLLLSDHLNPMLQQFFPAGRDVFQNGNATIHRALVVAQRFIENDTDVIHMSWASHSPDLNPTEHLRDIL